MSATVSLELDTRRLKNKTNNYPVKMLVVANGIPQRYQIIYDLTEKEFKNLSASRVSDKLQKKENRDFAERLLKETDHNKGVPYFLSAMYVKGLRVRTGTNEDGKTVYHLGKNTNPKESFYAIDRNLTKWFTNNNLTPNVIRRLNEATYSYQNEGTETDTNTNTANNNDDTETASIDQAVSAMQQFLSDIIKILLSDEHLAPTIGPEPRQRKKKRRGPNW